MVNRNENKVYFCDTVVAASHIATERDFECPFLGTTEVKRSMNRVGVFSFYIPGNIHQKQMDEHLTGYKLSRNWFDWCFENPEIITPTHTAMYFFIIEHWNRLGQKEKFGLPMEMTKDAIGIKNYKTFSKVFNDLVDWKFISIHQRSRNQYSANIIALVKNTKANTKALTKASLKHSQKQVHGIVGIDKPINQEPNNQEQEGEVKKFDFKKSLLEIGVDENVAADWMIVRKHKKASNTETALNGIKKQIELSGLSANECIKIAVERSWQGFKAEWLLNDKNSINGNTKFKNTTASGSSYESPANAEIFCGIKKD